MDYQNVEFFDPMNLFLKGCYQKHLKNLPNFKLVSNCTSINFLPLWVSLWKKQPNERKNWKKLKFPFNVPSTKINFTPTLNFEKNSIRKYSLQPWEISKRIFSFLHQVSYIFKPRWKKHVSCHLSKVFT